MDSRRSPVPVGASHFGDEAAQVRVLSRASKRHTRLPLPEKTKALPVPADDRLGLDDEEDAAPMGPGLGEAGPEGSIDGGDRRMRRPLVEECELLAESQILEHQLTAGSKPGSRREE